MTKSKVIIKEKRDKDANNITYITKHKGEDGICFTMAVGFGVSLAKSCGLTEQQVVDLVRDIYSETESDIDDEN